MAAAVVRAAYYWQPGPGRRAWYSSLSTFVGPDYPGDLLQKLRVSQMAEQEIFWTGRRPKSGSETVSPVEDPAFAEAVTAACEAAGGEAERYVASSGEFGSWLIELSAAGESRRLIWNGKSGQLSLDAPNPGGGWDELKAEALDSPGLPEFQAAMVRLLA